MARRQDPVETGADGSRDLYEIADWEVRSTLDRLSVGLYSGIVATVRWLVIGLALLIMVAQFALGGLGLLWDPLVGTFVLLSVVPAFLLAAYLWRADVTTSEPLDVLVWTFLLGLLFAGFAGVLNTVFQPYVAGIGSGFGAFPVLGAVAFFLLVVGPVEEGVKLLAVRLHAYRTESFDAVIDGAVYGAVAGLGFATIENAFYITQSLESVGMGNVIGAGSGIATIRALAGPGHVIYSAFAGYYLGLAKFNREHAGPLVVKGLLIAALIHAVYNISASVVVPLAAELLAVGQFVAFIGFVVVYDGFFILVLIRKLSKYNAAYRDVYRSNDAPIDSEPTEFE